ncbi:hypothetical protein PIB30_071363 [Stylosanthes scabra]|uniref:Uncharacterized protein n=1 Tax=Stylosanthes scabra TaxID=79078 RepID=A0ABU6QNS9_9FABA|nr:hypothetical protein [Stylosanthes scabra]
METRANRDNVLCQKEIEWTELWASPHINRRNKEIVCNKTTQMGEEDSVSSPSVHPGFERRLDDFQPNETTNGEAVVRRVITIGKKKRRERKSSAGKEDEPCRRKGREDDDELPSGYSSSDREEESGSKEATRTWTAGKVANQKADDEDEVIGFFQQQGDQTKSDTGSKPRRSRRGRRSGTGGKGVEKWTRKLENHGKQRIRAKGHAQAPVPHA